MSCILPNKNAEANAKGWLRAKGVIDTYLNILDLPKFRKLNNQLSEHGKKEYNIDGRWFYEEGNGRKAVPNSALFKQVDRQKNTEFYSISDNTVDANLKVIGALQNPKVIPLYNRFYTKGNKDKFYSELVQFAGKDQVELLKEYNETNNPQSLNDMITGLASELSYTVEIKTSVEDNNEFNTVFQSGNNTYSVLPITRMLDNDQEIEYFSAYYKNGNEITEEEYNKARKNQDKIPTDYYSNLTVPGGTNYTENEIATPLITPSIKGHAQFSTDNGIGWFRSDEKTIDGTYRNINKDFQKRRTQEYIEQGLSPDVAANRAAMDSNFEISPEDDIGTGVSSKTRRVLEVQSDLFQKSKIYNEETKKWEYKENLILKEETKYNANEEDGDIHPLLNNDELEDFDANEFLYKNPSDEIIGTRDWGYGKVKEDNNYYYFESGDNKYSKISKIKYEEEKIKFAKLERDQLKETRKKAKKLKENQFLQLLNKDNNWVTFFVKSIIQDSAKKGYEKVLFPSGDTASKVEGHTTLEEFKKQKEDSIKELERRLENKQNELSTSKNLLESDKRILQRQIEKIPTEINQLKQELKRVETEGFGALRPIHAFYEITVQNILNKQYGKNNIERVKDEFGNEWFELTLDESRDKTTIYFSKPLDNSKKQLAEKNKKLEEIVLRFLNKAGVKVEVVNNLKTRKGLDANAIADITNQLIKISKDSSTNVLSEEAAHFLVEMLGDNHPLVKQMMDLIENTSVFQEVMNSSYVSEYNNDIELLKKEAVGKLISQYINSNFENNTNEPKGLFDKLVSLIKKVLKVLTNKFTPINQKQWETEVFGKAANLILSGDVSSLSKSTSPIELYNISDNKKNASTGSKSIDTYIERAQQSIVNLRKQKTVKDSDKNSDIDRRILSLERYINKLRSTKDLGLVEKRAKRELSKLRQRLDDFESMSNKEMEQFYTIALDRLQGWSDIATIIDYGDAESNAVINNISGEASRLGNELYDKIKTVWLPRIFANNPATLDEILASTNDISTFESFTLDVNVSNIPIVRKIGELLDRASYYSYELSLNSVKENEEKTSKLKDWAKRNGLNDKQLWDLFQQKDSSGKNTGYYIHEVSADYYKELFSKLNKAKSGEISWKDYYSWLNKNTNSAVNRERYDKALEQAKIVFTDENGNINIDELNEWITENHFDKGKKRYRYIDYTPKMEIWKDKRFDRILNTPELKEYYDYFTSTLQERMSVLPFKEQQSKYYIPELKKGMLFDLAKMNASSLFNGMGQTFIDNFTSDPIGNVSYEQRDPITGQAIKAIPVYMMADKLNPDQKETDLSRVLTAFTSMSYAYEQKVAVEDSVKILKDIFKTVKEKDIDGSKDMFGRVIEVINANKGVIDQLDYAVDSLLYGNYKASPKMKTTVNIFGKQREISVEGGVDNLIAYTRLKGMAWNPFSAVTNLLFGISSNLIYGSANMEFTEAQSLKALGLAMDPRNQDKINAILKEYNVLGDTTDSFYDDKNGITKKVYDIAYILQTKTERLNYAITTIATMLNTEHNGKNLWESYKLDNSKKLVIENGYEPLSEEKYKLQAKLKEINKIIHGNYDMNSPMLINKTVWGRALMIFRRWLPMMIFDRLGSERFNDRLGRDTKGRWISYKDVYQSVGVKGLASNIIKELLSQLSFRTYNYDINSSITNELDASNMRRNVAELKFILIFTTLTLLLKGIEVDDDDEKKTLIKFLINQSMRLETDLTFFYKPSEFSKIFQNISPLVKTLKDIQELTEASARLVIGDDEIKAGVNKGRSRFLRELTQAIPGPNQMQRLYELKDLNLDSPYTR